MFFRVCQISDRRSQFFNVILSEIEVCDFCISLCIRSQGCNLCSCRVKNTCLSIWMYDIFTGIQSVNSTLKCCISLCGLSGFGILFYQFDLRIDTLVLERVAERNGCLFVCGVLERKRVHILTVSGISGRCRNLFHVVAVSDRQVCLIYGFSVCSGHCLLNEGIFFDHNGSVRCFDVVSGIQAISAARKVFPGFLILFVYAYACFLAVIFECHASHDLLHIASGIGKGDFLAFACAYQILWCLHFFYHIFSQI